MRTLNTTEIHVISGGGVGPGMFNGLGEALLMIFGLGIVGAFGLGVASVCAYQYGSKYFKNR